jgi:sugar phosphate isomerase/epimerase
VTFRFGIGSMQVGRMLQGAGSPEALLETILGFDHAAVVRDLTDSEPAFTVVELAGDLILFIPEAFAPAQIERLAALAAERGLRYTVHLPLWSVEPASPLAPVRRGSVDALVANIEATRPLDPEVYVLHATNALAAEFGRWALPPVAKGALLALLQDRAQQSVEEVLAATGFPNRALAIETVEFPFELTLELAEALDCSICLDVGHVLAGFSGPIDPFDALERCLPRLAEVHLHDAPWWGPDFTMRYDQDHRPLGDGDLDLPRLLSRLTAAAWNGPLILELRLDEARASLAAIRRVESRES